MAASAPPSLPPGSLFDRDSLTSLFSTLFATFGVIAIGYASKRTGYFSREAKAGLGDFVGKVALPALLTSGGPGGACRAARLSVALWRWSRC